MAGLTKRRIFDGFEEYYRRAIGPWLAGQESARRKAVRSFLMLVGLMSAAALIMFVVDAARSFRSIAFSAFVAGIVFAAYRLDAARRNIQDGLLALIVEHIGFTHRGKIERPPSCEALQRLKLLPAFNLESWEDEVSGERENARFTMCEAHLRMRKRGGKHSTTRTVFHGQIFEIEQSRKFHGVTVVQRDRGALNGLWKPGREFSRVGLASSEFERSFEAWSTDQVEARYLLDPLVLERFLALENLFQGKALRAAFIDRSLVLAIETGDRLTIGTMFRPIADRARVDHIVSELETLLDLVDLLIARVDAPLAGPISLLDVRR